MPSSNEWAAFRTAYEDVVSKPVREGWLRGGELAVRLDRATAMLVDLIDREIAEISADRIDRES